VLKRNSLLGFFLLMVCFTQGQSKDLFEKRAKKAVDLSSDLLNVGKYKQGLVQAKIALNDYTLLNNKTKISYCYFLIGKAEFDLDHIDSAMVHFMKGIESIQNIDCVERGLLYDCIGKLVFLSGEDSKALYYHLQAEPIIKKFKDTTEQIYNLTCIADDYIGLNKNDLAYKKTNELLRLALISAKPYHLAMAWNYACYIFQIRNKIDSAIWAGNEALKYSTISGNSTFYRKACINLSRTYDKVNDQHSRVYILEKGLKNLQSLPDTSVDFDNFLIALADGYYKLKEYKKAFDYYTTYTRFAQKEETIKAFTNIQSLELKYRTSEKEKQLAEQKLQLVNKDLLLQQNKTLFYIITAAFLLLLLFFAVFYLNNLHKRKEHFRLLKTARQQKEIDFLEALMQGEEKERNRIAKDLHDGIAGMLVGVKMQMNALIDERRELKGLEQTNKMITLLDDAYTEVRKTSHNLMPEVLLKHGLDEAVKRYCHNISSQNKLIIEYDSWGNIKRYKSSFELSIYRIIQELVTNIIKHSKATRALVQISVQDHILSVDIEDNGIGLEKETNADGMGLHSLERKIKTMDGKLHTISSSNSGFGIYMEFDTTNVIAIADINEKHTYRHN
jgi:Signal transduction histidine kinase